MKGYVPVLVIVGVLGLSLLSAGCMDVIKPLKSSASSVDKPSVVYNAKYTVGDIAIPNPDDNVGEVIQDYDPGSNRYSTRSIIFDRLRVTQLDNREITPIMKFHCIKTRMASR